MWWVIYQAKFRGGYFFSICYPETQRQMEKGGEWNWFDQQTTRMIFAGEHQQARRKLPRIGPLKLDTEDELASFSLSHNILLFSLKQI